MESNPKLKSVSKFYNLTSIEHINQYTSALQRVHNNPHKYTIIDNEVKADTFGEPFIIFQYMVNEAEEDRVKQKAIYFGEFLPIPSRLEDYDDIATKHWNDELTMFFCKDYTTKDKTNPQMYRIVLYQIVTKGEAVDKERTNAMTPKEGK